MNIILIYNVSIKNYSLLLTIHSIFISKNISQQNSRTTHIKLAEVQQGFYKLLDLMMECWACWYWDSEPGPSRGILKAEESQIFQTTKAKHNNIANKKSITGPIMTIAYIIYEPKRVSQTVQIAIRRFLQIA